MRGLKQDEHDGLCTTITYSLVLITRYVEMVSWKLLVNERRAMKDVISTDINTVCLYPDRITIMFQRL